MSELGHNKMNATIRPMFLARSDAAQFLALSEATLARLVAQGDAPKPKRLSEGRAAWLVDELTAWGNSRPNSDILPPEGSGYGRSGKPVKVAK